MELLRLVLFLYIITKYEANSVATLTCDDFFNFSDLDSKINDTFSAGDILFNVSDEIQFSNDCEDEPLLSITTSSEDSDESVVSLTMNVSEYCKSLIFCVFQCTKSQKSLIIQAPVKLTQEYDLQFEETIYTANVLWMSETGTPVTINKDLNLIVENCSTDVMFPSYTGRYSLDESLNVVPFKWMSEASGNSLFVSEDLNETIPVFNVIVLASLTNTNDHRLKGKATATIIVSVIDDTDGCNVNPCVNEGTCVYLTFGEYRCDCSEDWTGKHCDVDNNMIKPVEDTSIISIIGGTLGAVFGILLVICVTVIVLRKYKKDKVKSLQK